jgi:murein tripeptide amidase MpaA
MYRTVDQIDSAINILSTWFPQFFTRVQLPETSVEGRPVYALRMRAGTGTNRRGVLIAGGTHARELMNPDAIIDLGIDLLMSYTGGTDVVYGGMRFPSDDVKLILEAMDIWLLPCVNPDGRHYVMTVDDMWRKNRRDNPGTSCDGVDLNRNADIVWGVAQGQTSCSPCSHLYCGPSAFSEPETRNVKHILDNERIVSFVDVHSYSELILYPWGHAPIQSTDPSQNFTGLPTGTCVASIPTNYSEYMRSIDLQRFKTVAGRIVSDIAAVRGRHYTPGPSISLYATTGTLKDYAYSRHIANTSLRKTYGFTFETGPYLSDASESFHPADPSLIKRDAKAAMLALMRESVCAIELIGLKLFAGELEVSALRSLRDDLLATTTSGREWIALFERTQFGLLAAAVRDPGVLSDVGDAIVFATQLVGDPTVVINDGDVKKLRALLKKLRASVSPSLKRDLAAVDARLSEMRGRGVQQVIGSLMRQRPGKGKRAASTKERRKAK